jgi:hypothetical protein
MVRLKLQNISKTGRKEDAFKQNRDAKQAGCSFVEITAEHNLAAILLGLQQKYNSAAT